METRKAAFSGSWYPAGASECERQIKGFLAETGVEEIGDREFREVSCPMPGGIFQGRLPAMLFTVCCRTPGRK